MPSNRHIQPGSCLTARCRHYLDALLVAVVALCTLENDIVHAGYLATALFFFRHRIDLRSKRNRCGFDWARVYPWPEAEAGHD